MNQKSDAYGNAKLKLKKLSNDDMKDLMPRFGLSIEDFPPDFTGKTLHNVKSVNDLFHLKFRSTVSHMILEGIELQQQCQILFEKIEVWKEQKIYLHEICPSCVVCVVVLLILECFLILSFAY